MWRRLPFCLTVINLKPRENCFRQNLIFHEKPAGNHVVCAALPVYRSTFIFILSPASDKKLTTATLEAPAATGILIRLSPSLRETD